MPIMGHILTGRPTRHRRHLNHIRGETAADRLLRVQALYARGLAREGWLWPTIAVSNVQLRDVMRVCPFRSPGY